MTARRRKLQLVVLAVGGLAMLCSLGDALNYSRVRLDRLIVEAMIIAVAVLVAEALITWWPTTRQTPAAQDEHEGGVGPGSPAIQALAESPSQHKDLPVRWLEFYTYVRIPLGIAMSLILCARTIALCYQDVGYVTLSVGLTLFDCALGSFLLVGLHRRRLWGWTLNWVVLAAEPVLRPIAQVDNALQYAIFLVGGILFWLIPNAIYFYKRKYLFL